jgi:hypothetical protein
MLQELRDLREQIARVLYPSMMAGVLQHTGASVSVLPVEYALRAYIEPWYRKVDEVGRETAGPPPVSAWPSTCVLLVMRVMNEFRPDLLVSSLFCIDLADRVSLQTGVPWCFINSSFYFGRNASRPSRRDFAPGTAEYFGEYFPRSCIRPIWSCMQSTRSSTLSL